MKFTKSSALLMTLFLIITLASRWLPHPPNFTAVGALALMAGALWGSRLWAPAIPLAGLWVSDLVLGFHETLVWVYAGFVLVALLGAALKPQNSALRAGTGALASSLVFFAVSNFGVWMAGGLYPPTAEGLLTCYVMALPFLGWQIAGDVVFTAGFVVMARRWMASRPATTTAARRWA